MTDFSQERSWDYYSTITTALNKGRAEGRAEERRDNALKMKADGMAIGLIAKYTGLTTEEIERL